MNKVLSFQISLLGSFTNVKPNIELTLLINNNLKGDGFVPGTIQVNTVKPQEHKVISESRLQLVSADKDWSVVFLAERIDVNYQYHGDGNSYSSINIVSAKAIEIVKKAFTPISATTGTRMAVNGRFLLSESIQKQEDAFISRFLIKPKVYNNRALSEWSVHYNSFTDIHTSPTSLESCNFIIDIEKALGINNEKNTFSPITSVGIDINTSPLNKENKFTINDLLYFTNEALGNMKTALLEIEEV